jgi:ketosteroid isomerase-like protein
MGSFSAATRLFSILPLALLFSACATTSSPQEEEVVETTQPAAVVTTEGNVVTVPTELVTIHPGLITAWQGTDPEALRVYFSDDAVVVTPTGQFTGWEQIRTSWITPSLPMTSYVVTPSSFTREGTDIIVEGGNYTYRVTKEGDIKDMSGTYSYRWRQQPDGTWRLIAVDIK